MNEPNNIPISEIYGTLRNTKLRDLIDKVFKNPKVTNRNSRGNVKLANPSIQTPNISPTQMELPIKQLPSTDTRQMELPITLPLRPIPVKNPNLKYRRPSKAPKIEKPKVISTLFSKKIDMSKPPFYTDADKWFKENFIKGLGGVSNPYGYTYVGPNISKLFTYGKSVDSSNDSHEDAMKVRGEREKYMERWNMELREKIIKKWPEEYAGMNEQSMKLSEIKEVIDEIISEELAEVNHTTDSSGKPVIAVGAPGSIARFAVEHPDMIKHMRDWVKDCPWGEQFEESDIDDLSDIQILQGVQRHYEGGIKQFIQDATPTNPPQTEGVGYVHAKDRAKDPKSIKKPGGGTEHWRIKFQSASDLKKHGNTEMSKVKETIRELVDEIMGGERLDEVTVPRSQPTPNDPQQLWKIVDSLEYGQSISFYNPKNPSSNTTAPWIYIKKLQSHGGGGYEQTGFNLSIEPRMDARTQRGVLKGVDNLRSEDDVTEDEVSLALEAVVQNIDILSMYYIETEEQAPKKKPYEGDPDHDLGDYEKFGPDQLTAKDVTESKNMKKHELRSLIKESIEEVQSEMHGFEEQQELLSMKRIQSYAHWGFKNASKHPNEMQSLFQKIVKEIDGLVKSHESGHEVPIKHDSSKKSPLGVTQETVSKTKQLLDQMISQRRKK